MHVGDFSYTARFAAHFPVLLLDEPTASLDAKSRKRVIGLIEVARNMGSAIIAVFHDGHERHKVCTRNIALARQAV